MRTRAETGHRDTRRVLQLVLATIWLLDGALQFQPIFFTRSFGTQMIAAMAPGNPWAIARPIQLSAQLIGEHPGLANTSFAVVQILLGLGIARPRTLRLALGASVVWALGVWWIGEGLGGLLTGGASPLNGAPGAALLYAVVAVVLWPSRSRDAPPFEAARAIGPYGAKAIWLTLWGSLAWFAFAGANRSSEGVHTMFAQVASGEPGWLAEANRFGASLSYGRGSPIAIGLAVFLGLAALGVLLPPAWTRVVVVAAVLFSVVCWVFAEDLGGLFTGGATDPNSGLLLVLLALAYWPHQAASPSHVPTTVDSLEPAGEQG